MTLLQNNKKNSEEDKSSEENVLAPESVLATVQQTRQRDSNQKRTDH
jgi:hypothetical protein